MNNCIFCDLKSSKVILLENDYFYCIYDKYPVEKGHCLIITKRHVKDYFDLSKEEHNAMYDFIKEIKLLLDLEYSPQGYNIGINNGEAAGQTVFHLHIHLIPRYKSLHFDPRGGVRGVIPDKQKY